MNEGKKIMKKKNILTFKYSSIAFWSLTQQIKNKLDLEEISKFNHSILKIIFIVINIIST
jgi:hypothetical protein